MPVSNLHIPKQALIGIFSDREYYRRLVKDWCTDCLPTIDHVIPEHGGCGHDRSAGGATCGSGWIGKPDILPINPDPIRHHERFCDVHCPVWGVRDIRNIRKVLGLALTLGLIVATFFLIIAEFFPCISFEYLFKGSCRNCTWEVIIYASLVFRFIFYAISFCYSSVLRSTGDVQTPLFVTITALLVEYHTFLYTDFW